MPFSTMRRLLVFAVALATVAATTPAASSSQLATTLARRNALELDVVRELNRVRAEHGLRPLRAGSGLRIAAAEHSRAMLEYGFFEHESVDGTAFDDRIRRFYTDRGWDKWSVGETLLSSSAEIDASHVVAAWLNSRPHRAIILAPVWRDAGIGAYFAGEAAGDFGDSPALVVTADFGLRAKKAS